MIATDSGKQLRGDWRASAYGSARRVHVYTAGRKPACGARIAYSSTTSVRRRPLRDICYGCLLTGARR